MLTTTTPNWAAEAIHATLCEVCRIRPWATLKPMPIIVEIIDESGNSAGAASGCVKPLKVCHECASR